MTPPIAHTPGPWRWTEPTKYADMRLIHPNKGQLTVMDFVRRGMNGAQPRFARWEGVNRGFMGGVMVPATAEMALTHPDMRLIAAAPNLYDACWLMTALCERDGEPVDESRFRKGIQMAREALALADPKDL